MPALGAAAYGMYPRNVAMPEIVYTLNRAGFENQDICIVLSPAHPVATVVRDARIGDGERDQSAVSARMIGWFSEFGAVVIPTVGFFIRSRAFFRALITDQNFVAPCGGSRTMIGLGSQSPTRKGLATNYRTWARWCTCHVRRAPRQSAPLTCCV